MYREQMQLWVRESLGELGGEAKIIDVAKHIWLRHEDDLRQAGDAFYTWQYDMRWAADQLRRTGKLALRKEGSRSIWSLKA
ncbi:hypothetical protein [uncultured Sphingomonas sp.]|uniref:hypothetical protein n=1 Tax=uncultured Sphingomonas sp. TaxID=158754 RepID=UPI002625C694|nr:hypothetical protein [uncultured Sphingomonas sp.]